MCLCAVPRKDARHNDGGGTRIPVRRREAMAVDVRLLRAAERFEAKLISTVAFHSRLEDMEKARADSEKETVEDWGAFADDGTMMARIINNRYETYFDGSLIANGGIGAVSTLPEYRNEGAIRAIFERLLPHAYRNGEVISTLYPFNHAFYRKFGYDTACWKSVYEFEPDVLRGYRFSGRVLLWRPGDPVEEYTTLYNRFAAGYNLAVRRDDRMLEKRLTGDCYKDRKFCYMLYENGKPAAYLIFQDVRHDPAAILSVRDLAWDGRAGLRAILGFLARFTADYGKIELFLPRDLELYSIIRSPRAYDIGKETRQDYMIRVINARKLLAIMKKPDGCRFVIRVSDEFIPENNGVWEVCGASVLSTDKAPDLAVSERALGQMAAGLVSLEEAKYRDDVEVSGNEDVLKAVFVRKPILVEDYF